MVTQQRNTNKDFRVLFGDIFIVPFLGPALGYLTAQCAARGWEIWLHLTEMICPWAGNLAANFWKMSNPHPMPCLPSRRFYIDRFIGIYKKCHNIDYTETKKEHEIPIPSSILFYTELIIKLMNSQNFSVNSHLLKFVSLCNDLRNNLLSNHADDTWLTIVIIALHYHCYDLFVCLFLC